MSNDFFSALKYIFERQLYGNRALNSMTIMANTQSVFNSLMVKIGKEYNKNKIK